MQHRVFTGAGGLLCNSAMMQRLRGAAQAFGVQRLRAFAQHHAIGQHAAFLVCRGALGAAAHLARDHDAHGVGPPQRSRGDGLFREHRHGDRRSGRGARTRRRSPRRFRASRGRAIPRCTDRKTTWAGCCRRAAVSAFHRRLQPADEDARTLIIGGLQRIGIGAGGQWRQILQEIPSMPAAVGIRAQD